MFVASLNRSEIVSLTHSILLTLFFSWSAFMPPAIAALEAPDRKKITVMCYMNGDNNLTHEVLHAVDMMETVGSSPDINILVLVDGGPEAARIYGKGWDRAKLLYITRDHRVGAINSPVLQDLGEQDLGDPRILCNFIKACLQYPAERYLFCMFAHGRGIIDTDVLETPVGVKSVSISPDDTSQSVMSQQAFHDAVQDAMGGLVFDAMIFLSCLTNMVEIGYSVQDLTRYMIASEDEIRIVNKPPGTFQIRGIKFEKIFKQLQVNPSLPAPELGIFAVNNYIAQYMRPVAVPSGRNGSELVHFSGSLALVDCRYYRQLAARLDNLAKHVTTRLMAKSTGGTTLNAFYRAASSTQRYASFLNLEYYDLRGFLENLRTAMPDDQTNTLCQLAIDMMDKLVVYQKHTHDRRSGGVSIYLSNRHLPENVYQAHHHLYRKSHFSKQTAWDEMIDASRKTVKEYTSSK